MVHHLHISNKRKTCLCTQSVALQFQYNQHATNSHIYHTVPACIYKHSLHAWMLPIVGHWYCHFYQIHYRVYKHLSYPLELTHTCTIHIAKYYHKPKLALSKFRCCQITIELYDCTLFAPLLAYNLSKLHRPAFY